MKKLIILSFILFTLYFLPADTHIPSGDVSGTWTIDGSPYIIDGYITVPIDSTLIIEPSVFVIFSTNNGMQIEGRLLSEGTENDSIIFTVQDSSNNTGLGFYHTDITNQDSSKITYSIFEHVSVCFDKSSNILFRKSSVSNCVGWSGVFFDENSSPTLKDIIISNNTTDYYGGGIYCTNSSNPSITNVIVSENSATWGGGISCRFNSNPTLENVNIINNGAIGAGGGIFCEESSPSINNVIIDGNEGSGICCTDESSPTLNNVTISNNNNGIGCFNSSPILNNVIISGNSGGGIYSEGTGNILLQDFIITGNNSLSMGGGVAVLGADMIMVNGRVAYNHADDAGGIYCHNGVNLSLTNVTVSENSVDAGGIVGGIGCEFDCNLNITNSIVWNNAPMDIFLYGYGCESDITYSDIGGEGWQGEGNINTDPLFADDEFHLLEGSPCIDAGNPDSLYYDIEDPYNPGYALYPAMGTILNDMGTYGGHGYYEPPVSIDNYELHPATAGYELYNYPNPFNPRTTIQFSNEQNQQNEQMKIEIYNIKGQKIDEIAISNQQSTVSWNAEGFASGIYLYKLNIKDSPIKKMILLK